MGDMTRGAKKIIDSVIEKYEINVTLPEDKNRLCNQICVEMEEKYPGKTLEYNAHRMGLETTKEVKDVVDVYYRKYFMQDKKTKE